jgi:hypothetical protein
VPDTSPPDAGSPDDLDTQPDPLYGSGVA